MKTRIVLLTWVVLCCMIIQSAMALGVADGTVGNTNATTITAKECLAAGDLYTVISNRCAIGSTHTAIKISPGDDVLCQGKHYTVKSVTHHSNPIKDQSIITINEEFPTNSWAELLPMSEVVTGAVVTVVGNGDIDGEPIFRQDIVSVPAVQLSIVGMSRHELTTELWINGNGTNGMFVVEQTTNLNNLDWITLLTVYTTTGQVAHVDLSDNTDPSMFYRIKSVAGIVTNQTHLGYKLTNNVNRIISSATNIIYAVDDISFRTIMRYGSCLAPCDSSGGTFVGGKLAGINRSSDTGPFSLDGVEPQWFDAALFDLGGLYVQELDENGNIVPFLIDTENVYASVSVYRRVDIPWAMGVCNASNQ